MALVFCNDEESTFFCSMSCRYKYALHVFADRDSDVMGHRSGGGQ
jgi:hypothetical protein